MVAEGFFGGLPGETADEDFGGVDVARGRVTGAVVRHDLIVGWKLVVGCCAGAENARPLVL